MLWERYVFVIIGTKSQAAHLTKHKQNPGRPRISFSILLYFSFLH